MKASHARRLPILGVAVLAAACGTATASAPDPTAWPVAVTAAPDTPTASPSAAPSVIPTLAPSPADEPTPSPLEPGDPFPTPPPLFGMATLQADGVAVVAPHLGGCGSLWHGDMVYGSDSCGPWGLPFEADAVMVQAGGRLTFAAPEGVEFSIDAIASDELGAAHHSWEVTIHTVSGLRALPEGDQNYVRVDQGAQLLGYGDRAVISAWVTAPRTPGEYVVQLAASVRDGPWTSTWPLFFWRVSVR